MNFPDSRTGYSGVGQAPSGPSPYIARGVNVNASVRRGPFGGWLGRFRQRIQGGVGGQRGSAGGGGPLPGTTTIMPHRVEVYRKAAFWNPAQHYSRREYLVEPPNLPGTAIQWTLFHPVYQPNLRGWKDTLPTNYFWEWARNTNFEKWGMLQKINDAVVTGRGRQQNVWKPVMKVPQGVGQGQVWQVARPSYIPNIINPNLGGGRNARR